jgi:hypothetical protein
MSFANFIHIDCNGGHIGNFWWINPSDEVFDLSDNPWSSFLVRRIGSFGFGPHMVCKVEPLSDIELFG